MKRITVICGIIMAVIALTACSGKKAEETKVAETVAETTAETTVAANQEDTVAEPDDGRKQATEYTFSVDPGQEQMIEGLTFSENVTIEGAEGVIMFQNCRFEKNIINNGTGVAIVRFLQDNEFGSESKAVISSGIKEATLETNLPKMMFFCEPIEVTVEDAGAIVTFSDYPVVMNGKTYKIEDSDMFMNDTTGEFAEYSGQEANMHNVASWIEGGEIKNMQVAIYADMG